MEIFVETDLSDCVVFLVPLMDNRIDYKTITVMQKLQSKGATKIKTVTMKEACFKFAEVQQGHSQQQKFLKVTPKGGVTQLFY